MSIEIGGITAFGIKSQEEAAALVGKLFDVARPAAVFGEPVQVDDHTVITASEVKVGMGFGFGGGGGSGPAPSEEESESAGPAEGIGGGGGGGGVSGGRPVAAIIAGPGGVTVEPIVDVTKIALAAFTTLGAMLMMLGRMRAAGRELMGE